MDQQNFKNFEVEYTDDGKIKRMNIQTNDSMDAYDFLEAFTNYDQMNNPAQNTE